MLHLYLTETHTRHRGRQQQQKRICTMCKSKLRTLLFFSFIHFIYLSLAIFFFYLSPLRVCHHARCSFSVGSTCKVAGSVGGGVFSHIRQLERGRYGRVRAAWRQSRQTLTARESPEIKLRQSKPKDRPHCVYSTVVREGGLTTIEDPQKKKEEEKKKQLISCRDKFPSNP